MNHSRGYTLVELIVAVGLFAVVMMLVTGAYLVMVGVSRQAQGLATGINNLSFALETMTRNIRTGSNYKCQSNASTCQTNDFTFKGPNDPNGTMTEYNLNGTAIQRIRSGQPSNLTDSSVTVSSLTFYVYGANSANAGPNSDYEQARVLIVVSGSVSVGPGKTQYFTVESTATMRGSDI